MRRHALILAACAALGGCMLGPNYQRPEVKPPEQYRGVSAAQKEQSLADAKWFDLFAEPELSALIREVLERNPDLRAALARIEDSRARSNFTRASIWPNTAASLSTAIAPSSSSNDSSFSAALALNWEIDLFGKLRRSDESARAALLASEDNARAVMASLVSDTAIAYFQLRELDEERDIVMRTIVAQEESLRLVRSQMNSGVASGSEEQQAIAQLATTRSQLPTVQRQLIQAENALSILAGGFPRSIVRRPQTGLAYPVPPAVPAGLPAQLLERRPDVRAAENQLHAAVAQIGVAAANRFPFPTIGLTAALGVVNPKLADLFSGTNNTNFTSWGPSVSMPLLDFGRAGANYDSALAQARLADAAYRATVLQSVREVSDALVASEQVLELIAQNQVRVTAARESLRLTRLRYRSGVANYLEVLDGERQLFAAEIDLARANLSRLIAYAQLYRALGGGWSDEEIARLTSGTLPGS